VPEVVLMAILGNFHPNNSEAILRIVIERLRVLVKNKRILKKYFNQLMMLSRLRKIEGLTIKIVEEMPVHFDIETDTLYLRGNEKGIEKGIEQGIEQERRKNVVNLWQKGIEPVLISNLLNLTIEYVERVIADF
jgi:CRISPR/Cas system CMR subunit Cmr6 (Cas7 group RAMP superfamily)